VWVWAALLACNPSVLLQAIIGLDTVGFARGERLRGVLLNIPARVIRHARRLPAATAQAAAPTRGPRPTASTADSGLTHPLNRAQPEGPRTRHSKRHPGHMHTPSRQRTPIKIKMADAAISGTICGIRVRQVTPRFPWF
jgi:hypothetical protein